jgi:hypothetical protein
MSERFTASFKAMVGDRNTRNSGNLVIDDIFDNKVNENYMNEFN